MSTFLPCLPLRRNTKEITGTPRPPPPPTHLPSYALWHSYWAACFRHCMRNRSGNGLLMCNRSQNGHDEKSFRLVGSFSKKAHKGGVTGSPEPPPPPHTHTHTPLAQLLGSSFQTVLATTLKMGTTRKSTEL